MVNEILVKKTYKGCKLGKFYGEKHYSTIIKEDCDCYWIDKNGNKLILFKLRKKAIPEEYVGDVINTFLSHTKKLNSNRGYASGAFTNGKFRKSDGPKSVSYSREAPSGISGYFDRPSHHIKGRFNTNIVCRTTRFTRDYPLKWNSSLPFFISIDRLYKKLAPLHHKKQKKFIDDKILNCYKIKHTVFTTVTSNYNWRTACHTDSGDFLDGLGNLIIMGDEKWKGCYLGFPEFQIAVDVRPLDFLLMDVHQYHCNTRIKVNKGMRLSFVCYLRENMKLCNTKKIIINTKGDKEVFHYYKK